MAKNGRWNDNKEIKDCVALTWNYADGENKRRVKMLILTIATLRRPSSGSNSEFLLEFRR